MKNEEKTLYLECKAGISGDMTVAALLDLGADEEGLKRALAGLKVPGYEVHISRTVRSGMAGCDFDVALEDVGQISHHEHGQRHHVHDHAHESHGHEHGDHEHGHKHGHDGHGHDHAQAHSHPHGSHMHRNLHDILHIIEGAELTPRVFGIARKTFEIVAEAEAKAHGIPVEDVHFHEVGAVDSIVDIVAVAYCLADLGVSEVVVPYLCEGSGTIRCQHGVLPVPVPAVANIAAAHGIALRILGDVDTELVTPTGAAIVAANRTAEKLPEGFKVERVGVGLGKRDIGRPNFLRAMLIVPVAGQRAESEAESHTMLESNIDDSSGELLGLAMEKLMAAGALDVHYIPCFMKKNRPGYLLRVICREENVATLEDLIFRHTTTIGVRRTPFERTSLKREQLNVALPEGSVLVKKCLWQDEAFYYPEFESVRALAEASGRPFPEVYAKAKVAAGKRA